jgi:glycosyltransferase involved in cell wall biosynthesis
LKVLFLVSDPALGPDVPFGDSIRVRLLLEALRDMGAEVDVRWAGPAAAPTSVASPRERRLPELVLQTARDIRSLRRARELLGRLHDVGHPDVVFEFASYLAPVGIAVARRVGVPYVVEVEGPLASLRYERGSSLLRPLGELLERRRLRAAATVITVSSPLAHRLEELGARHTSMLANVADDTLFRPQSDDVRRAMRKRLGLAKRFVVGFHGVLSPWYGLDALVDAVALAAKTVPEIALLVVGDGVERGRIEALAVERGIADRFVCTGFVPHSDVASYVDVFDLGVIADHVWWTSPLKLFEYGAMRKPVVAAAAASIIDVVPEGAAVLVSPRDANALAASFVRLAADREERERLASAWHERVMAEYIRSRLSTRLEYVLNDVVNR